MIMQIDAIRNEYTNLNFYPLLLRMLSIIFSYQDAFFFILNQQNHSCFLAFSMNMFAFRLLQKFNFEDISILLLPPIPMILMTSLALQQLIRFSIQSNAL